MFFFNRAFRGFFLFGAAFSALLMLLWGLNYPAQKMTFSGLAAHWWHAHEMVFGYALATVTGFLLTAVMNWTQENTASGKPIALLLALWLGARLGFIFDLPMLLVAAFDMSFVIGLFLLFTLPIWRKKLKAQIGLASKFFLIVAAQAVFYIAAIKSDIALMQSTLYAGLFLVLAINLTMMRRLLPFFTEKGLRIAPMRVNQWIDRIAIALFFVLMVQVIFVPNHYSLVVTGFALFIVHGLRAWWWYHSGIWSVVLLWPLHVSYWMMIAAMGLVGLVGLGIGNMSLAIHAFAVGGIGLLCTSIMARVSLGHTNRDVFSPPRLLSLVFILVLLAALVRVVLAGLMPSHYILWIHISQGLWALGFLGLVVLYWKILTQPSVPQISL